MVYLRQTQILQLNFEETNPINYNIKCEFIPDYLVVKQIIFSDDVLNAADEYDIFSIQTDLIDNKCGKIIMCKRNTDAYPNIFHPISQPVNGSYSFKLECSDSNVSLSCKAVLVLEFNKWVEHAKFQRR